jgi:hypothetical protein
MIKKIALFATSLLILFTFSCELLEDPDSGDPRDNFTGNWTVNEVSALYGINNYNVTIVNDPANSTQVLIRNFYHFGMEIETFAIPTISSITIPQQFTCNHTVKGNGMLSKNKIDWTYTVDDGADIDQVTAVYTRQ